MLGCRKENIFATSSVLLKASGVFVDLISNSEEILNTSISGDINKLLTATNTICASSLNQASG
jgi:hypothetical protein